jgi:two-component system, LytTR family, sensor kinase
MIVPLSIQMLFENAVKHNVISRHKKLKIYIGINDNCIFVENNLQVKDSLMSSNGIGLENIQSRYKLSANKDIQIIKTDYLFRVELPLIAS